MIAATPPIAAQRFLGGIERRSGLDRRSGVEQRLLDDRERFVAFAFAGADLLLEATADGRITFAAGAFRTRLGCEPDALLGRGANSVVAAEDRPAFATCLALLAARGRIAPTALRLADAARTPYVLSGLCRPGPDGSALLCLSFGAPPGSLSAVTPALCSAAVLGREAEARLRASSDDPAVPRPTLDVLEVVSSGLEPCAREIAAALLDHADVGIMASELAPGRFGLLYAPGITPHQAPDLAAVTTDLERALRARGINAKVTTVERLPLAADEAAGVTPMQAVRALRYALSTFARGGAPALAAAGFAGGLTGFMSATMTRTADLRRAIAKRRFRLAFQPIVRLEDRVVHHYEALLRPEWGPGGPAADGPGDLVTVAEMVGLTEELDWAVFEAAREAAGRSGAAVAFNVSGLSVQNPAFRDRLIAALDRPLPRGGARLLAELTESAEIEDEAAAADTIAALRQRGVPVSIDDFGAGAAAFRYLRRFQVDHVKIDGAYVRQAAENERDRSFVAAMVDLSLAVGAHTIAEQIETEAVADVMRGLGVHYGQGWLFGRPGDLPAAAVIPHRRRGDVKEQWA